jgi:hypothetical protein
MDCLTLEYGTVGSPETSVTTTNIHCVTTQKIEDLVHAAADACNLVYVGLIGVFVKLRKATTAFFMSVRMEQRGSQWTELIEI